MGVAEVGSMKFQGAPCPSKEEASRSAAAAANVNYMVGFMCMYLCLLSDCILQASAAFGCACNMGHRAWRRACFPVDYLLMRCIISQTRCMSDLYTWFEQPNCSVCHYHRTSNSWIHLCKNHILAKLRVKIHHKEKQKWPLCIVRRSNA